MVFSRTFSGAHHETNGVAIQSNNTIQKFSRFPPTSFHVKNIRTPVQRQVNTE